MLRERIHVKVSGGVATLSGGVATQEQIALGSVASQVEGISCVNNLLKLGTVETDDPSDPRN